MNPISRRNALTAAAAGSLLTAATIARAQSSDPVPQPQRPGHGGTDPGPRNVARDRQNPDILVPPSTDHGTLPNLRFSFSDAHMRLETGGWTRQVTVARARRLQEHRRREHAAQRRRRARTALAQGSRVGLHALRHRPHHRDRRAGPQLRRRRRRGRSLVLPAGHSALDPGLNPDGCEFLLVFDDGDFDEDNTFLITDWFKHIAERRARQELRRAGVVASGIRRTRASATSSRPRSLDRSPRTRSRAQRRSRKASAIGCWRSSRSRPRAERYGSPTPALPGFQDHRGGAGRGRSRRNAGVALASQHRRVAILHRGPGAHGRVRRVRASAHLRLSCRRRRLRALCHGPLRREYRRRRRCAFSKCSRAATSPTCRSTSGWR